MVDDDAARLVEPVEEERAGELQELQGAEALLLTEAGTERWTPRELQARVRNGHRSHVLSLAFWQLVNDGQLVLDRDLRVRRARKR